MTKFLIFSSLVVALSAYAMTTSFVHAEEAGATAPLAPGMVQIIGFVERALVEPVADLERKARKGYASDRLVYGLALKAGRAGPGQEKNARKWITKARNSFERRTPSQRLPDSQVDGNAGRPARNLEEKKGYNSNGTSYSRSPDTTRPNDTYIGPMYIQNLNPDLILVAEACVEALLMAPDPNAKVSACGSEAEYARLLTLMPKKES